MTVLKRKGVRWTRGVRADLQKKVDNKEYMDKAVDWLADILTNVIMNDSRMLDKLDRKATALDMFIDGYSLDEISEETGYTKRGIYPTIIYYCKSRNLDYNFFKSERNKNKKQDKAKTEKYKLVFDLYVAGLSLCDIAEKVQCDWRDINRKVKIHCKKNNIDYKSIRRRNVKVR